MINEDKYHPELLSLKLKNYDLQKDNDKLQNDLNTIKGNYKDLLKSFNHVSNELKQKDSFIDEQINENIGVIKKQLEEEHQKRLEAISSQLIKETQEKTEAIQRTLTNDTLRYSKTSEWEKIIDEMAHSINTDVFVAVSNLSKIKDEPRVKKASYYIKQIRDLINLIMWYLKRNDLTISNEFVEIELIAVINEQISTIKDGISTLRISTEEHQSKLIEMNIDIAADFEAKISINKEIAEAISLIVKDLLRNALKNTDEKNPIVSVNIKEETDYVILNFENNCAIQKEFADWFNGESDKEPDTISKSTKVGLRVIKMWTDLLKIKSQLIPDNISNSTLARITFPKRIRYENN